MEEHEPMKIRDDKFFVLEIGEDKWIIEGENQAVKFMKQCISKAANLSPENVSILEVNTKEKKWEVKELPWSKIAIALIKDEV